MGLAVGMFQKVEGGEGGNVQNSTVRKGYIVS